MMHNRFRKLGAAFLVALLELHPLMVNAAASFKPGTCQLVSSNVCVDATPCKVQNGTNVCLQGVPITIGSGIARIPETCWQYASTYSCLDEASFDDCKQYSDRGCVQVGSTCTYKTPSGICTVFDQTYQCQLTQATTSTTQDCSAATICSNGNCWATPQSNYGQDFGSAMAGMELARQASVYKDCDASGNCTFFKGVGSQCNEGYFGSGMGNCCMTSGVQANDHSVAQSAGMSLAMSGGVAGAQAAGNSIAQWTFSYLYSSNPDFLWDLISSSTTAINLASDASAGAMFGGATFGAFGFSVGSAAAGAGGLTGGAGTMVLFDFTAGSAVGGQAVGAYAATAVEGGAAGATMGSNTVLMFNPYVFAAIVAYMVITEMMKCTEDEQVLSLKRGTNLCVQADRWCTQKIPLVGCERHAQSYCCYNSLLAKAINVQGRAQVGRPIGGGQGSPDCSGLTLDEMQRIDFSRVDFSEFISSVTQGAYGTSMTAGQSSAVNSSLQNKMLNRCANGAAPDSTGHCPNTP